VSITVEPHEAVISLNWYTGESSEAPAKELVWIGSSLKDLRGFPAGVRQAMGHALKGSDEMSSPAIDHTVSSGNVFKDLELPASDELLAKAELARQIARAATHRRLTQAATASILGTTQPKVSDLLAGRLAGFSMERLIRFLNALDRDVQIVVSPKRSEKERATTKVISTSAVSSTRD
jgi:predicted XRE-type DNA-binding protein